MLSQGACSRAQPGAGPRVLTARSAGEAAVVVEVAHGLASLVCSVHPLAALHAGAWKGKEETKVSSGTPRGRWLGGSGPSGSLKPQGAGDTSVPRPGDAVSSGHSGHRTSTAEAFCRKVNGMRTAVSGCSDVSCLLPSFPSLGTRGPFKDRPKAWLVLRAAHRPTVSATDCIE